MKKAISLILIVAHAVTCSDKAWACLSCGSGNNTYALRAVAAALDVTNDKTSDAASNAKVDKFWLKKAVRDKGARIEIAKITLTLIALIVAAWYFYESYETLRNKSPWLAEISIAGIIYSVSDYLRQRIQILKAKTLHEPVKMISGLHILKYGLTYSAMAGLIVGYLFHDSCLMDNVWQKVIKMPFDLIVFMPYFFTTCNIAIGRWLVEGRSFEAALEDAAERWWPTYKLGLKFWAFAEPASYFLLSKKAPFISIAVFGSVWSTILSFVVSKKEKKQEADILEKNFKIYEKRRVYWLLSIAGIIIWRNYNTPWQLALLILIAFAWDALFTYELKKVISRTKDPSDVSDNMIPSENMPKHSAIAALIESDLQGLRPVTRFRISNAVEAASLVYKSMAAPVTPALFEHTRLSQVFSSA